MDPAERSSAPGTGAITRRRVVTTVGHTAWAAPVIVAATAAPAFAGSLPGAAVITTTSPTFTIPPQHVRAAVAFNNSGTAAPASMTITVTITPTQGSLQDVDPEVNSAGYEFVNRVNNVNGSQTLTFTKLDPQIPAGTSSGFSVDFFADPDPITGATAGNYAVSPSVPPPGSATSSSANYLTFI
jgi:hypothetical protein